MNAAVNQPHPLPWRVELEEYADRIHHLGVIDAAGRRVTSLLATPDEVAAFERMVAALNAAGER